MATIAASAQPDCGDVPPTTTLVGRVANHVAALSLQSSFLGDVSLLGSDVGLLGERTFCHLARVLTGVPHVALRFSTVANEANGFLTFPKEHSKTDVKRAVARFFGRGVALLLPGETGAMETVDGGALELVGDRIVANVYFQMGDPHQMKQTAVTDEYSRGDMECPNCERMGPSRYTGHKYCVKCGFCTYCSLVNPFCKPLTEEEELNDFDDEDFIPDEDLTPAQLAARRAKEDEVLKRQAQAEHCAQHMPDGQIALEDFYEWQEKMMVPDAEKS
jgi:hypothetical protein